MQSAYLRVFRLQQLDFRFDDLVFGCNDGNVDFNEIVLGFDDSIFGAQLIAFGSGDSWKRFFLDLGLRLQPRDIRFRLLQLQLHHPRALHLSKRLPLRFRMRRPKRSRLIRCCTCALVQPMSPPTPRIRLTLISLIRLYILFMILLLDNKLSHPLV